MTIPSVSNYPTSFDSNTNLYEVHDALRMNLAENYSPGDTSITVSGDALVMENFPESGLITLTDQCNNAELRGISFFYGSRTDTTFNELEILPGFTDTSKIKNVTNVTLNVMASHHNNIKDALIAIQNFIGVQGTTDTKPFGDTMEGRFNFLKCIVFAPKAWFSVNKRIGIVPLTVEFTDLSFRLGKDSTTGPITFTWDFGDNTGSVISIISVTDSVPTSAVDVLVRDLDGGKISKTYTQPGIYDVTLTVENSCGSDSITLFDLINARVAAPDEAIIDLVPRTGQILTDGDPSGGPFDTTPKIRASINTLIDIQIQEGVHATTGKTYAGEEVDGNDSPIDPIIQYTWSIADDLLHTNSRNTRASFGIGGIFDLTLRVDTSFGAFRITNYEDTFDIVEKTNLWLWNFVESDETSVHSYEFGLLNETFKVASSVTHPIAKDDSFLDSENNSTQQKREFNRNNGFAPRGTTVSGDNGNALLYWAGGRTASDSASEEVIRFVEFNGFVSTYIARPQISRPWNWVSFASSALAYFILGNVTSTILPNTSPTNQEKITLDLINITSSTETLTSSNYKNGADELTENVAAYSVGVPTDGHFSVYRATAQDKVGYFLRNDGVGTFFRIKSFYKTEGTVTVPFQNIRKLPDMAGSAKLEGQLVTLSSGIYFFNNSGAISKYVPSSGSWSTGGPGLNSASFRSLQDTSISGFDSASNTLLATSDNDRRAYLSYDYSPNAFIKFNESDSTFSSLVSRPSGTQWQMRVF